MTYQSITWDNDSQTWHDLYNLGLKLEERWPNQCAYDLISAISYNSFPDGHDPKTFQIINLVMHEEGSNDCKNWIWEIQLLNGETWFCDAGCDFTGWDCLSWIEWTLQEND